jgi:hypothetical protein
LKEGERGGCGDGEAEGGRLSGAAANTMVVQVTPKILKKSAYMAKETGPNAMMKSLKGAWPERMRQAPSNIMDWSNAKMPQWPR